MLRNGVISKKLETFIKKLNVQKQEDAEKSIKVFCDELESEIYSAIKSATIIIPPGAIMVTTPQGPGSNVQPIMINNALK